MPNTLTAIPATITAGDSYAITLSLTDYPAPTWALSYDIAGPSVQSWTSTASGDAHLLPLPAADTATLGAGTYQFRVRATRSGDVVTVQSGVQTVVADLGRAAPGELASYWEQLKTAAETALTTLMAAGGVQMVTILGRQTMFRSPEDCLRVIAMCNRMIASDRRGTAFGRVSVRFAT